MKNRKYIFYLGLVLLSAALLGCGAKDEGKSSTEVKVTPEQIDDATSLAMVRAHQEASIRLYAQGKRGQAAKHAGHPIEEIFWSISRSLRSKDAVLTAELRKSLKRSPKLIFANAPERKLDLSYEKAWVLLDRAQDSLVPKDVRDSKAFHAQLVSKLLETAQGEYGEAVKDGKVIKEVEYQDAWGALNEAHRRSHADEGLYGSSAPEIEKPFMSLMKEIPSPNAPAKPPSVEAIGSKVKATVNELSKVSAGAVASDPLEEIDEAVALLKRVKKQYAAGNRKMAEELAIDAYLNHFEKVEPELAKGDRKLMEDLEALLTRDLREEVRKGSNTSKVYSTVDQALRKLDMAKETISQGT